MGSSPVPFGCLGDLLVIPAKGFSGAFMTTIYSIWGTHRN
jgi:hypothetical protein